MMARMTRLPKRWTSVSATEDASCEAVAHHHVRLVGGHGSQELVDILREVGVVAVHDHADVGVHRLQDRLHHEALALRFSRTTRAPAWAARAPLSSLDALSTTRTSASGSSFRKSETTLAMVVASL